MISSIGSRPRLTLWLILTICYLVTAFLCPLTLHYWAVVLPLINSCGLLIWTLRVPPLHSHAPAPWHMLPWYIFHNPGKVASITPPANRTVSGLVVAFLVPAVESWMVWSNCFAPTNTHTHKTRTAEKYQSVLHQQRCQPVSRKVHARQREGGKQGMHKNFHPLMTIWRQIPWEDGKSIPTDYLLLNLKNLGRGMEGTHTFCFSPSKFVSKNNFLEHQPAISDSFEFRGRGININ